MPRAEGKKGSGWTWAVIAVLIAIIVAVVVVLEVM